MTTTVVKTIGTGGDYSLPQSWEDASPADLTSVDQVWQGQLKKQLFSSATTILTMAGSTSDATRYKELTTAPGAGFEDAATPIGRFDSTQGAALSVSGTYGNGTAVSISENYARVTGVQIASTTAGGGAQTFISNTSVGVIVDRCIIESLARPCTQMYDAASIVRNSLLIRRGGNASLPIASVNAGSSLYNCTLAATTTVNNAIDGNYSSPVVRNCAMFGATAIKTGGNSPTYTTCITDIASPPSGFTTSAYSTSSGAKFVNITDGTHDFRIQSGSALIDAGTTDATNAPIDIFGTTRPQGSAYDVGCQECVVAGGFKAAWARNANAVIQ